jgi:glycosyltransferase involved in cell wall biosynthesis
MIHNGERKPGGESIVFERECQELTRRGHEVFALRKSNADLLRASVPRRLLIALQCVCNVAAFFQLRRLIAEVRPHAAVVHNAFPLWSVSVYLACFSARIPVVQVVHNFRFRCLNGLYFRAGSPCLLCQHGNWLHGVRYGCVQGSRVVSFFVGLITQLVWPLRIAARISRFRALSDFARAKLADMGISPTAIEVIPNFGPLLGYSPAPNERPTWLVLGHVAPEKGVPTAFDALAAGAPGTLVVVGSGPLEETLRQRAMRESLRVEFLGHVTDEERFRVLAGAWALIFPSRCFENGPLAVIEALSLSVPVIASDHGSIPEYVRHGVSGLLFPPGDGQALRGILQRLVDHPDERQRLAAGARREYETHFHPEVVLPRIEHLLAGVQAGRTSNRSAARGPR